MLPTTDDLISDIKIRGAIPTNQNRFTESRFLSLANSEMQVKVLPMVIRARQNYYEYDIDTAINASGLYPVSTRAYLGLVSNVGLIDSTNRFDLPWLSEETEVDLDQPRDASAGIILKRNTLQLKPKDGAGFTHLRSTILLRPGLFVLEENAAQITGISGTTLTFASSTIPSTWTTSNTFDLIQGNPQYDTLGIDLTISAITSTTIVLSATPNSRLAVGDWIALAGQSPIVQLPEAFSYFLSQRVANICMLSMGDKAGYEAGKEAAKDMEKELSDSIQPRIQKEAQRLVNRTGLLRRNGA